MFSDEENSEDVQHQNGSEISDNKIHNNEDVPEQNVAPTKENEVGEKKGFSRRSLVLPEISKSKLRSFDGRTFAIDDFDFR